MDTGADLLMFETTFHTLNLKAGIYAVENLNDLYGRRSPVMLSVTLTDASGRTLSGQTLEAQTESLLCEGIEGVHLYALNRLETVRRFSQLIQPVSGIQNIYS